MNKGKRLERIKENQMATEKEVCVLNDCEDIHLTSNSPNSHKHSSSAASTSMLFSHLCYAIGVRFVFSSKLRSVNGILLWSITFVRYSHQLNRNKRKENEEEKKKQLKENGENSRALY